jgi:hypothetical protein
VELGVSVNLCSVHKTSSPGEDTGDWVSGSGFSLLILSPMSGDSSVSSLRFKAAILVDKNGGHETERTETLSDDVGLNISIVVLAGPDDTSFTFDGLGDHIINKSVFIRNSSSGVFLLPSVLFIDSSEGI